MSICQALPVSFITALQEGTAGRAPPNDIARLASALARPPLIMETVPMPAGVRDAIMSHSRAELPNECCGLLVGRDRIERSVPMRSDPPAPDAYCMDPEQQVTVFTDIEARGERLLGIYHSHPAGPARPSGIDLQLAFHPEALYVIISLADAQHPEIGVYRLEYGQFKELEICLT
jgi:proteasome lid subunit RPN8/RPN11